ncbi:MAG: hypothetical protein INQ03_22395 [Candidatus Heimdallarchaeota archaeon]|nr:hypothetical protein [Candidatus Heimdallarchaeota archaeon]
MIEEVRTSIENELNIQHFGVLSSVRNDKPHQTLVCFAPVENMQRLVFFTPKNTRKFINAQIYEKVSMFLDTTTNSPDDVKNALTISANGIVLHEKEFKDKRDNYKKAYLKKNPHMEFFLKENIEMVVIKVEYYELVKQFQTVLDLNVSKPSSYTLSIRQIQGEGTGYGEIRKNLKLLGDELVEGDILVCEEFPDEYSGPELAAIVQISKSEKARTYADQHQIPCVSGLEEGLELFSSGDNITVDGYLGMIILHKVK